MAYQVVSLFKGILRSSPPLSGPWTPEASASYPDLCQFGPHLASLQNGTIITFKIWDRIKDLPRYK